MNQHANNHSLTQAFLDSKTISEDQICVPLNLEEFILNIEARTHLEKKTLKVNIHYKYVPNKVIVHLLRTGLYLPLTIGK